MHLVTCLLAAGASAAVLSPATASAVPGTALPLPLKNFTVTDLTGFTSPSGNIGCYIDSESARCDIRDRDWAPPAKPADCPEMVGFGQGITLNATGSARFVCAGDTALGGGQPLAYGDSISSGPFQCESTQSGITCRDFRHRSGFTLSREGYEMF
jgi:hypothetical protein